VHALGRHGLATGGGVGMEELGSSPKPPTSPLPPKRQAGAQSQPMSSAGSPCGPAPVENAAQPVGADQEVAEAIVTVDRHPRPTRWAVGLQPAHAELERGPDLAERIEEG